MSLSNNALLEVLSRSGLEQARLVREGEISSAELLEASEARLEQLAHLNAVIDRGPFPATTATVSGAGPFAGVPFSVKDSIEVQGTVCSAGTLGYRNRARSAEDAVLVRRLREAGATPFARTNLPDLLFAFESDNLLFGRTSNPYDLSRTSGGSSGGEAALIAACGSPFGLGSDAAGSVRLPAHYCGIASLKPTSGCLDRTGHVPPPGGWLEMIWQIGPMARHVEDLIAMMPILKGAPLGTHEVSRIAFFTHNGICKADADTASTVRAAALALSKRGYAVEEGCPRGIDQSYDLEMKFIGPDGGDSLRDFLRDIGSDPIHPLLEAWLQKLEPYRTDLAGFMEYWSELDSFRDEMTSFLDQYDAIVSPVAAFPAVPHGQSIRDDVFPGYSYTMTYNMTGWPAAVVRCGSSAEGLPIGVQIASAKWREDVVLRIARELEEDLGGWQPPPEFS